MELLLSKGAIASPGQRASGWCQPGTSTGMATLVTALHGREPAAHRALCQPGSQLQCLPVWLGGGSWGWRCSTMAGRLQTNPGLLKDSLAQSRAGFEQGKKQCSVHPVNFGCACTCITANVFLDAPAWQLGDRNAARRVIQKVSPWTYR